MTSVWIKLRRPLAVGFGALLAAWAVLLLDGTRAEAALAALGGAFLVLTAVALRVLQRLVGRTARLSRAQRRGSNEALVRIARVEEAHAKLRADLSTEHEAIRSAIREAARDSQDAAQTGRQVLEVVALARQGVDGSAATLNALRRDLSRGVEFAQVEALLSLYSLVDVRAPIPPSRGWASSPDLCLELVRLVLTRRPRLVVECGPGLSTIWIAYALERVGDNGRVVSLEHDESFAELTSSRLREHGLSGVAEVRVAPLVDVDVDGVEAPWYDPAVLGDLRGIDLLFVDGPPALTGPLARLPAVPLLRDRLSSGALVVLDDCVRDDEQTIVARWQELTGGTLSFLPHEKRTAVLSLGKGVNSDLR